MSMGAVPTSSAAGDIIPRPPPRRRASAVAGQQRRFSSSTSGSQEFSNSAHTPRRSLATVVNIKKNICLCSFKTINIKSIEEFAIID